MKIKMDIDHNNSESNNENNSWNHASKNNPKLPLTNGSNNIIINIHNIFYEIIIIIITNIKWWSISFDIIYSIFTYYITNSSKKIMTCI